MSKRITPVGRLSFPSLFQPRAMEGAQPKYEATVLMEPSAPCIKAFMQEALEVLMSGKLSLSEEDARQLLKAKPPIKDGDQKQAQGYAGNYYITCRSTQQPDFYGPDKSVLTSKPRRSCSTQAARWPSSRRPGRTRSKATAV